MNLTKRDFLKGLAAIGAAFPHAAQAKPKQRELFPNLSAAVTSLAQKSDVVFLADANHRVLDLRRPLSDAAFLNSAARANFTSVGIEYSRAFQPYVDELVAGTLSKPDFVKKVLQDMTGYQDLVGLDKSRRDPAFEHKQLTMMAREIEQIHKAGMKPVFIDPQHPLEQVRTMKEVYAGREHEAVEKRLREYDGTLAADILQAKGDTGKMLVMYGYAHLVFVSNHHVDDNLRARNAPTATILMTDNPLEDKDYFLSHKDHSRAHPKQLIGEGVDIPDRIYSPLTDYIITMHAEPVLYRDPAPAAIHPVHTLK